MSLEQLVIGIVTLVNLTAFMLVWSDKQRAKNQQVSDRLPEGWMFFMAIILGALGVYVGMLVFRHKTRKWYFLLGIPLLIIQNAATVYLVRQVLLL